MQQHTGDDAVGGLTVRLRAMALGLQL
jgi:hypothetical protein